jgi:KDO2-lipid IV(A) lauroyltransferase
VVVELITEFPNQYDDYQITDIYLSKLEKQIREIPEYYYWTHNRFKHKDKAPQD